VALPESLVPLLGTPSWLPALWTLISVMVSAL
jgi:hypothetical protein